MQVYLSEQARRTGWQWHAISELAAAVKRQLLELSTTEFRKTYPVQFAARTHGGDH